MAKTKVEFVIASGCCGAIALILMVVSLSTEFWITADVTAPLSKDVSTLNYGLFSGTYNRISIGTTKTYYIYPVCLYAENICMMSCLDKSDDRFQELMDLHLHATAPFKCTAAVSSSSLSYNWYADYKPRDSSKKIEDFISDGLYIATVITLIVALVMNVIGTFLNIYNIFTNPIQTFLSLMFVPTFYVVSLGFLLLSLILWGVQYNDNISENAALLDTLAGGFESDSSLGWSYFLMLPAFCLNLAAACLILYRARQITIQASAQVIRGDEVNNNANTFMY